MLTRNRAQLLLPFLPAAAVVLLPADDAMPIAAVAVMLTNMTGDRAALLKDGATGVVATIHRTDALLDIGVAEQLLLSQTVVAEQPVACDHYCHQQFVVNAVEDCYEW